MSAHLVRLAVIDRAKSLFVPRRNYGAKLPRRRDNIGLVFQARYPGSRPREIARAGETSRKGVEEAACARSCARCELRAEFR